MIYMRWCSSEALFIFGVKWVGYDERMLLDFTTSYDLSADSLLSKSSKHKRCRPGPRTFDVGNQPSLLDIE